MLLATGVPTQLGVVNSPLRFGAIPSNTGPGVGDRALWLNDSPAFELSYWTSTIQYLFRRLHGANQTLSLNELQERLTAGLSEIEQQVVQKFSEVLPPASYLPLLLEVKPQLISPGGPDDYFRKEQLATWTMDTFFDLPEDPHVEYYRTFETRVDDDAHLFEFIVPMVSTSWLQEDRVNEFETILRKTSAPTAVALGVLDVCAPATVQGPDWFWHWGLAHFLLDGHHKLRAAARTGTAVRLLSLVTVSDGLGSAEQVARLPQLLTGSRASRPSQGPGTVPHSAVGRPRWRFR